MAVRTTIPISRRRNHLSSLYNIKATQQQLYVTYHDNKWWTSTKKIENNTDIWMLGLRHLSLREYSSKTTVRLAGLYRLADYSANPNCNTSQHTSWDKTSHKSNNLSITYSDDEDWWHKSTVLYLLCHQTTQTTAAQKHKTEIILRILDLISYPLTNMTNFLQTQNNSKLKCNAVNTQQLVAYCVFWIPFS